MLLKMETKQNKQQLLLKIKNRKMTRFQYKRKQKKLESAQKNDSTKTRLTKNLFRKSIAKHYRYLAPEDLNCKTEVHLLPQDQQAIFSHSLSPERAIILQIIINSCQRFNYKPRLLSLGFFQKTLNSSCLRSHKKKGTSKRKYISEIHKEY